MSEWNEAWEGLRQRVGPEPGPVQQDGLVWLRYSCGCPIAFHQEPAAATLKWLARMPCDLCEERDDGD